eukprot:scaffold32419_cov174-Isochrysis_galbana.AAC.2
MDHMTMTSLRKQSTVPNRRFDMRMVFGTYGYFTNGSFESKKGGMCGCHGMCRWLCGRMSGGCPVRACPEDPAPSRGAWIVVVPCTIGLFFVPCPCTARPEPEPP